MIHRLLSIGGILLLSTPLTLGQTSPGFQTKPIAESTSPSYIWGYLMCVAISAISAEPSFCH